VSEPQPAPAPAPVFLRPRPGWRAVDFAELWRFRELLGMLVARDVKVRYKQTVLGAAWAVLQPLATMLVFSLFFGVLMRVPSEGVAYPVFVFTALLPWQLFAYALTSASNSLIENERLITKVYFPRLIVPAASVVAGLVDFAIALLVLLGIMAFYRIAPGWAVLTLPLFVALAILTALAVGLWLAALNAMYRDFRYTLVFLSQLWFYATPIITPPAWSRGAGGRSTA
jgi:lipopolysaccharide transport system permease protein